MVDDDLFCPELTEGYAALSSDQRQEIGDFLTRVVAARGFPLHVATLWNALYFGYDPNDKTYSGRNIRLEQIPVRTMALRARALPVGSFVRVQTETLSGELWAEVVYKEGRHAEITSYPVPPRLSGARGAVECIDGRASVVLREALVLDFDALGRDWNDCTPAQFNRIMRKSHWLDSRGHLIMDAIYDQADAEEDDATLYARYLFREHRDGLLEQYLGGATSEDVWQGLLSSIIAVGKIASECTELAAWQDYYFHREPYQRRLADRASDSRFGRHDLEHIYLGIARVRNEEGTVYSAVGPRIREAIRDENLPKNEESLLQGAAYATAVCHVNAYIAERLTLRQDGDADAQLSYLRLDDGWQAGGIWRAESLESEAPACAAVDPLLALGLGYRTSEPLSAPAEAPVRGARYAPPSMISWREVLKPSAIEGGELRLSAKALETLSSLTTVGLRIEHNDQEPEAVTGTLDIPTGRIRNLTWPLDFFPGIRVYCSVEPHAEIVTVRTRRLLIPEVSAGEELWFEHDRGVYERYLEFSAEPEGLVRLPRRTSLRELVAIAFRTKGHEGPGNIRQLTHLELIAAILGPDAPYKDVQVLLSTLADLEIQRQDDLYTWNARVTKSTTVRDETVLATYEEAEGPRLRLRNDNRFATWKGPLRDEDRETVFNRVTSNLLATADERGFVTFNELARATAWLRRDPDLLRELCSTLDHAGVVATRAIAHTRLWNADVTGVGDYFEPLLGRTPSCRAVLAYLGFNLGTVEDALEPTQNSHTAGFRQHHISEQQEDDVVAVVVRRRSDEPGDEEVEYLPESTQRFCVTAFSRHQLSKQQEEDLVAVIVGQRCDNPSGEEEGKVREAKASLFDDNLWLVIQTAGKFLGLGIDLDDLIQEGAIGLTKAIDRYKPGMTPRLMRYAQMWIMQGIHRALADKGRCVRLPVHVADELGPLEKAEEDLWCTLGRKPTSEEIGAMTGTAAEHVVDLLAWREPTLSVDELLEQDLQAYERAVQPYDDGISAENQRTTWTAITAAFRKLNARQRTFIGYYTGLIGGESHTYEQIGLAMGLTRERVQQVYSRAIEILQICIKTAAEEKSTTTCREPDKGSKAKAARQYGQTRQPWWQVSNDGKASGTARPTRNQVVYRSATTAPLTGEWDRNKRGAEADIEATRLLTIMLADSQSMLTKLGRSQTISLHWRTV